MIRIGDLIDNRYRILSVLGEGGMGSVFEAIDIITKRNVALKFLKATVAKDKVNLARFEIEARATAMLNHPNIVRVISVGKYNNLPYMVNELIVGKNLEEELDERGKYTYLEAIDIVEQLCSAVSVAHQNGIIHRDIKPSNVYITRDGLIKLGDFGIARYQDSKRVTSNTNIVGSAHYLAPEVCEGGEASERSDIYALGINLFQLVTGRVPFDGDSNVTIAIKQVREKFPKPRKFIKTFPVELERIILKTVRKKPRERYQTVDELKEDLVKLKENPALLEPRQSIWVRWFGFAVDE
ncbi:MAG TPA: protein kinase [Bacilli bacterium]|nr:protein kinase [Bacilli bacterium]